MPGLNNSFKLTTIFNEILGFYGPNVYGPNVYGPNVYGPNVYGPNVSGPNVYGFMGGGGGGAYPVIFKISMVWIGSSQLYSHQ